MEPSPSARTGFTINNLLPVALTVIAVMLALNFFGQVAGPLLAITLAVILATALNPAARFFERWLPRGLAASLTVLLALALLIGMGWLAIPPILAQLTDLVRGLPTDLNTLEGYIDGWLERYPQLEPVLNGNSLEQLTQQVTSWATGAAGTAAGSLVGFTGTLVGAVFTGVVTLVMVLFVLSNPTPLINGLLNAVPPKHRVKATKALAQILQQMGSWGRATLLIMLIMGVVMAAGLYFLGVQNWLIFGVIAALGELVPNIGPIAAIVPPILFTLAEDPQKAIYVIIFSVVVQQLESYVLAPFLLGGAAKMHPVSVTIGVLLFGSVFGLVGAFLTVPFLIVIKALYENFYLREKAEIPDAVASALISGKVSEQLQEKKEAREEAIKEVKEAREAELERKLERGEVDLEKALRSDEVQTTSETR